MFFISKRIHLAKLTEIHSVAALFFFFFYQKQHLAPQKYTHAVAAAAYRKPRGFGPLLAGWEGSGMVPAGW